MTGLNVVWLTASGLEAAAPVTLPLPQKADCQRWSEASLTWPPKAASFEIRAATAEMEPSKGGLVLGNLAVSAACPEQTSDEKSPHTAARNVVVVLVDAARGDCFGPARTSCPAVTPQMDKWFANGTLFASAFSLSNQTRPSITALLQGQPPTVGKFYTRSTGMPRKTLESYRKTAPPLLPVLLRKAGFRTASIGRNHFQFENGYFGIDPGFHQIWDLRRSEDDTSRIVDRAIEWLQSNHQERFFLLVNLPAPHLPYGAPQRHRDWVKQLVKRKAKGEIPQEYLAELAYADAETGRLFEELKRLTLLEETVVVVTADHGEAHSRKHVCSRGPDRALRCHYGHGYSLNDEEIHVPLMFLVPGYLGARPGIVAPMRSHLDLAPTLLELLGLPPHPRHVGESLVPDITGTSGPDRPAYSEARIGASLRSDGFKFILKVGDREVVRTPSKSKTSDSAESVPVRKLGYVLYNLVSDPDEVRDLAAGEPTRCEQMRGRMKNLRMGWLAQDEKGRQQPWPAQVTWKRDVAVTTPQDSRAWLSELADGWRRFVSYLADGFQKWAGDQATPSAAPSEA